VFAVVFDEFHYMNDPERGTVWEESVILAPKHILFVALSATMANVGQVGSMHGLLYAAPCHLLCALSGYRVTRVNAGSLLLARRHQERLQGLWISRLQGPA
jgi:hypothetical protein